MGIDELCALPVADLAAPDSALFLWATFPQLPEALRLIQAWGFTYKSVAFVWLKKNRKADSWFYGLGFWTRGNAEICLLATRGHPKRQAANVHQFIIAPIQEHSRKPDEARDKIVALRAVRPAVPARLGCVGERGGKHRPGLLDKVSRGGPVSAITLGSLFDGIGVFPLAASRCGIRPLWASEIEAAPISITRRHFPDMAHLGDITKLDGGAVPPVHVLTFGSPCQNLSQIGRREGLDGAKSGLFFHAIRIIQEMRKATNDLYPVITIWENVMGAFSSNDRMDFRAVLSAFTDAEIPMPASGRWANAGMVRGGCPDLAWRLMDAQHWARPRLARRQRVFLVADFRGRRAPEILFKPRPMQPLSPSGRESRVPAPGGDRGPFLEARGRIPIVRPFQGFRMRGAAKGGQHTAFRNSFGLPTDPFPTLLAGTVTPFAFWYEDDPAGGCVRFPTELECERLMGLPEGWTKYGADGKEISAASRYKALGNAIALPCAEYIMAGIAEVLR